MARIRTIKPEFWTDEKLSALPESVHMLAAALLNYADDEGYFNANATLVKAACCPLREPSVSIHGALSDLSVIDYLRLGEGTDGRCYGWVVGFKKHQRVNRPSPSRIKGLVCSWKVRATFDGKIHGGFSEPSVSPHGAISEPSVTEQGTGNRELNGTGNVEQGKETAVVGYSPSFSMFWNSYPQHRRSKMEACSQLWNISLLKVQNVKAMSYQQAEDWMLKRIRVLAKMPLASDEYCPGCEKYLADARFFDDDAVWQKVKEDWT